ncbi:hypothetical protein RDWZM_001892, partial [Blomia tropicalis]
DLTIVERRLKKKKNKNGTMNGEWARYRRMNDEWIPLESFQKLLPMDLDVMDDTARPVPG